MCGTVVLKTRVYIFVVVGTIAMDGRGDIHVYSSITTYRFLLFFRMLSAYPSNTQLVHHPHVVT